MGNSKLLLFMFWMFLFRKAGTLGFFSLDFYVSFFIFIKFDYLSFKKFGAY